MNYVEKNKTDFEPGDFIQMKKSHPCGSKEWEIIRTGMDFGLKCCGCGHRVMLPRTVFMKSVREKLPYK